MKDVAEFKDQFDANAYCDSLQSKGIHAVVETFSLGSSFIVKVPDNEYEKVVAEEIPPSPIDDEPIVKCPHCGNADVEQSGSLFDGVLGMMLVIPMVVQIVRQKRDGVPYKCNTCGRSFRFKL